MFPGAIAADAPNRPAVIMASTGQVITFKELDDAASPVLLTKNGPLRAPIQSRSSIKQLQALTH